MTSVIYPPLNNTHSNCYPRIANMNWNRSGLAFTKKRGPWHTVDEWYRHNRKQYRMTIDRGVSADTLIEHSERIRDRVKEDILKRKDETELLFRGRIEDVDYLRAELETVRKLILEELEVLDVLQERIQDELKCFRRNAAEVVDKCINFRKERLKIDLIHDEVEQALEIEKKQIHEAGVLLDKALEESKELKRDLRASLYLLNRDVKDKLGCLAIEIECLNLNECDQDLSVHKGGESFDKGKVSLEEWTLFSQETIKSAEKKIKAARLFQVQVKILLQELMSDLMEQYFHVNQVFERSISDLKEAKIKLEDQHKEMTRQVNSMKMNIANLSESIGEKEGYLALAQTRLEKRSNRPGAELVKDRVEASLVAEILEIKDSIAQLTQLHSEAEKSLKYLTEGQILLEDEINVKMNSIKIDEVDCMTIRQNINYQPF